ncbi:MAG: cytochrome P450 [Acidimicrobiia bacterium]|nr:MAG: cytochrome P450 [Acidimicrobiia bacterium]
MTTDALLPPATDAAADDLLVSTVLTDEGRQDPYPAYAALRAGGTDAPGRWRTAFGSLGLAGYDDCLEALRHPRLGRPEPDMDLPDGVSGQARGRDEEGASSMLFLNPPDHTRIRGLVSRAFTPRRVEELRPRIEALLTPVLERFAEHGGGDVMADLAIPFPVAVISELLGVPREGNEHIQPLVRDVTSFIDAAADDAALERAAASGEELQRYFTELIEDKRSHPDDRLLTALIQVEEAGDRLSHGELLTNTVLLYAAGFETTSNLIGNGLRLLLNNPDQMARLQEQPDLLPSAMWEILRADSPVQLNNRVTLEEVELFGQRWPRGSSFIVLQGSANHDESVYPDAAAFDVARFHAGSGSEPAPPPLSFGWGAHHCLGAHLARAEGEIAFGALLRAFRSIELDADALPGGVPHYRPSFTLRGLDALPVVVTPA